MKLKYFCFTVIAFVSTQVQAQLGFCSGSTGNPIFEEDFGQGLENGPPLSEDVTSYTYVEQAPQDGEYTISSNLFQLVSFHNTGDHTGNTNGKALIVNASFEPGLFYQIPITGLCINNSYEFSAFLMNIYDTSINACPDNGIPVNVKFQIWDETDTELLAEGDTGNINGTSSPIWQQYALTFTTLPGQTSVILKMLNNGEGGCGNDLAIDDIVFKSCGDFTEIVSDDGDTNIQICENENLNDFSLEAIPDFSVYSSHFYQWQESEDGENWTNIPGETNSQITIPEINSSRFYRTLVAEDQSNIENTSCNSISSVYEIESLDFVDPLSLGDVLVCDGESQSIGVENNPNISVNWYDSASGSNLLAEDTFEFIPDENGTYYAEATTLEGNCTNPNRIEIDYLVYETPQISDETIQICEGETITLSEEIDTSEDIDYLWSNGETTSSLEVNSAGDYTLEITTEDDCTVSKTFTVETFSLPVISSITQEENSLIIEMETEGEFMYSIDGTTFQNQSSFENLQGGLYTIYVRENNGCGILTEEFLVFNIPEVFSPNGDNINDTFKIEGDIYLDDFEIMIFDRYGKLLIQSNEAPFEWDGTYKGKNLPTNDYWYKARVNNIIYTGNITLKR